MQRATKFAPVSPLKAPPPPRVGAADAIHVVDELEFIGDIMLSKSLRGLSLEYKAQLCRHAIRLTSQAKVKAASVDGHAHGLGLTAWGKEIRPHNFGGHRGASQSRKQSEMFAEYIAPDARDSFRGISMVASGLKSAGLERYFCYVTKGLDGSRWCRVLRSCISSVHRDHAVEALESCIGAVLANKNVVMHIGQYSVTNSPLVPAEQEAASRPIVFDESDFDHTNTATYGGEANDVTAIDPAAAVGTVLSPLQIAARAVAAQEEAVLEDAIDADETAAWIDQWASQTDPDDLLGNFDIAYLPPPTYHEESDDIVSHHLIPAWGTLPARLLLKSQMEKSDAYIAAPAFVAEDDDDNEDVDHYPADEEQHRVHQLQRFENTKEHFESATTRKETHEAAFAVQEAQIKAEEEHRRLLVQEEAELNAQNEEEVDVPEDYYGFPTEVLDDWTPVHPSNNEGDGDGKDGSDGIELEPPVDDDDNYGQSFDGFEDTGFTDKPPVIQLTATEYKQQVDDISAMNSKCDGFVENIDPFEATSMGIWGNAEPGDYMVVQSSDGEGFDVLIDVGEDMPSMLASDNSVLHLLSHGVVIKTSTDGRYQYNDRNFTKLQAVIDDMARRPVKVGGTSVRLQRAVNPDGSTQPVEFRRSSSLTTNNRGSTLSQDGGDQHHGGISAEDEQQLRVTEFFNGKGSLNGGGGKKHGRPNSIGGPVEIVMVPPLGLSFYATPKLGCFVKRIKPGGAAASTGRIDVGMRMLAVNGQALNGLTQASVIRMVKDTQGTCAVVFATDPEGSAKMLAFQQKRGNVDTTNSSSTTTNSNSTNSNVQPGVTRVANPLYQSAGGLVTVVEGGTSGGGGGSDDDGEAAEAINRQLFAANVPDGNGYVEVNVDGYLYGDGAAEGGTQQSAAFAGVSSPEPGHNDDDNDTANGDGDGGAPPAPPPRRSQTDANNNETRGGGKPVQYFAHAPEDLEGMYSTTIVPDGIAAQINSLQRTETTKGKMLSSPTATEDVGGNGGYVEVNVDGYLFGDGAGGGAGGVVGDGDFTQFSRQEAEAKVLEYGQEGSYVLRPSTSCTSGRVLTAYFQGRVKHVQIDMVERGPAFHFRGMAQKNFPSVRDLIDAYTNVATFVADGLVPAPLIFAG